MQMKGKKKKKTFFFLWP